MLMCLSLDHCWKTGVGQLFWMDQWWFVIGHGKLILYLDKILQIFLLIYGRFLAKYRQFLLKVLGKFSTSFIPDEFLASPLVPRRFLSDPSKIFTELFAEYMISFDYLVFVIFSRCLAYRDKFWRILSLVHNISLYFTYFFQNSYIRFIIRIIFSAYFHYSLQFFCRFRTVILMMFCNGSWWE